MEIAGKKLFVKALMEEGVDTIFGYPGGTVTDLFDELYKTDGINLKEFTKNRNTTKEVLKANNLPVTDYGDFMDYDYKIDKEEKEKIIENQTAASIPKGVEILSKEI